LNGSQKNLYLNNIPAKEEEGEMNPFTISASPIIVRTCFTDQTAWEKFCEEVAKPVNGMSVPLSFVDNPEYQGLSLESLQPLISNYADGFLFIVDQETLEDSEYPVLVVDLVDEPYASFRSTARLVGSIAASLAFGNADFYDFAGLVDEDGVFRKIPDSSQEDAHGAAPAEAPEEVPSKYLYIGSLPYNATDNDLRDAFSDYGKVVSAHIAKDSEGRFRGFGRIEMDTLKAAQDAKEALNGAEFNGRNILVAFDGPQWPQ
jgi:hypothetical protein